MRTGLFTLVVLLSSACLCSADVIAEYDFDGEAGTQASTAADTVISGVTASAISRGGGVNPAAFANSMSSNGWTGAASADALDYYELTITPNVDFFLTLTSLSFREDRSGLGPTTFEIRSNLDSFAAAISGTITSIPSATDPGTDRSFSLDSSFSGLTSAVTFRIFAYSAGDPGGTWRLLNQSSGAGFLVEGTVAAVPEASSFLFGGLAAVAFGIVCYCRVDRARTQLVPVTV